MHCVCECVYASEFTCIHIIIYIIYILPCFCGHIYYKMPQNKSRLKKKKKEKQTDDHKAGTGVKLKMHKHLSSPMPTDLALKPSRTQSEKKILIRFFVTESLWKTKATAIEITTIINKPKREFYLRNPQNRDIIEYK